MPLNNFRVMGALACSLIGAIASLILGAFGLFGILVMPVGNFMEHIMIVCFFFTFLLSLITLASLRWATLLMWLNILFISLYNAIISWPQMDQNPFDSLPGILNIVALLSTTCAFLFIVGKAELRTMGIVKLIKSLYQE